MLNKSSLRLFVFAASLAAAATAQQHKELGRMWTFENAPLVWFEKAYDFTPAPEWLEHARLSSLRLGNPDPLRPGETRYGCSASFVSARGLIMTNQHCARDAVSKVQGEHDWVKDGFYAGSFDSEVKMPGLKVQQLVATRDVTKEIQGGAEQKDVVAKANQAQPGLSHSIVTLYQGGMFQLYSYRTWDDVRLVCAPHLQSAHFGGDPDNFCYPRYALDFTFLRAYQDGKPAETEKYYFQWKTAGAKEGELVFVTGNPGSTGRLQTYGQCEFARDHGLPQTLATIHQRLAAKNAEAKQSPEKEKQLRTEILGLENSRKAYQGYLDGLREPRIMAIKQKAESEIRGKVDADPALKEKYGDAWDKIAALQPRKIELLPESQGSARAQWKALTDEEARYGTRVGEAFFAVYGTSIPPDASNVTLRISDGIVKGFPMNGTQAPYFTSLYGLYARHTEFAGEHPFDLPQPWVDKRKELDLSTPVNFVATCDIIGGNSGSPVIDKEQNVVGLIFDGNIEMLGNRYVFDDEVSRSVSVHPAFIMLALRKIYGASALADELEPKAPAQPQKTEARKPEPAGAGTRGG